MQVENQRIWYLKRHFCRGDSTCISPQEINMLQALIYDILTFIPLHTFIGLTLNTHQNISFKTQKWVLTEMLCPNEHMGILN